RWPAGAARNRASAGLGRPTVELPGGPAGAGEGRAPPGRGHPVSHADERRRVGGRQRGRRAAPRPDVQAGAGSLARGRGAVLAIDDLAAGKPSRSAGVAAPWACARRAVLRLVPSGAEAHRPRYRRHLRPRAWRPATAPVQTPTTTITASSRSLCSTQRAV